MESRLHSTIEFPISNFRFRASNFKFQISIFILLTIFTACKNSSKKNHVFSKAVKYTCSMHPQVLQDKPGTCPICGMELVKVTKSDVSDNNLMLTDSQIKLANITTQKVSKKH